MNLTHKDVKMKIKNNYSKQEIADELNISLDDLDSELHRLYHEKQLVEINRSLKANEKKPKKHTNSKSDQVEPQIQQIEIEPDNSQEKEQISLTLDQVLETIDKTTAGLLTLERRHRDSEKARMAIKNKLAARKQELLSMQEKIKQIEKEIPVLLTSFKSEDQRMKAFNVQIAEKKSSLAELEILREKLNTISILIYKDGTIEIDNEKQSTIPEEWREIYKSFFDIEDSNLFDNLLVSEQKCLAQLFAVLKNRSDDRKIETYFDVPELETAFEELKSKYLS